ncbi:MAG: cytochrome c [Bacteroidota bacterium]
MSVITKLGKVSNLLVFTILLTITVSVCIFFQPDLFTTIPFFKDQDIYIKTLAGRHTIELGAFRVTTPQNYRYIKKQGIDSYVGLIASKRDTIYFDYGWYSNGINRYEMINRKDTINGAPAIIKVDNGRIKGVNFAYIKGESGLSLYCNTWDSLTAIEIIKSIKFPHVDGMTSIDPVEFVPVELKGERLFKANCSSCHQLHKKVIGPPLAGVVSKTSREWFRNWVINPDKFIRENREAAQLFKEYNEIRHTNFTTMKEEDIDDLIAYVENEMFNY